MVVEKLAFTLFKNKVTKNGFIRFADDERHNIYMSAEEVAELGNPDSVVMTIVPD